MISLHKKDLAVLQLVQAYFGGAGSIVKHGQDSLQYAIANVNQLTSVVIPHFDKYNLNTKKRADFYYFKMAVLCIKNKEHLTQEGLEKVVALKASLNKGLSEGSTLRLAFPNLSNSVHEAMPLIKEPAIPNPNWVAGFTAGEGCFLVKTSKSSSSKLGIGVQLVFQITQHSKDEELMKSLIPYLGCGRVVKDPKLSKVNFMVSKFSDIKDKIIPFFDRYFLIEGEKYKDYRDWCKVGDIMKTKYHLTKEGLDQVIQIKAGMNRGRSS